MRSSVALAMMLIGCGIGCGGRAGSTTPQDRGPVQVVRCRVAAPMPVLGHEAELFATLRGVEGGLIGALGGDSANVFGELRGIDGGSVFGRGTIGGLGGLGSGAGSDAGSADAPVKRAPVIVLGQPSVVGSLAPEVIASALAQREGQLAACAAKHAELVAAGKTGRSLVESWRFTISGAGKVIQADPTTHDLDDGLAGCVTAVIRGAAFPPPPDARVVSVALGVALDASGTRRDGPDAPETAPWSPYALESGPGDPESQSVRAAEGALRHRLGAIGACFAGSPVTGSMRAMLQLTATGELEAVRVGGLGDRALEACVENALTGLRVASRGDDYIELACDLSRGDAQPWRVTPDRTGYGLVEVSRTRVAHGDQMISAGEEPEALTEHGTYAIVVDPDAPGSMLALALMWTRDAGAALVALRDKPAAPQSPKSPAPPASPPPQFLAMGYTSANGSSDSEESSIPQPTLEVGPTTVTACVRRAKHEAKLSDPTAISTALDKLATRCRAQRCSQTLAIAVGKDALAKDLAELTGAARRAGFDRIILAPGRNAASDASSAAGCETAPAGEE